MRKLLIFCIMLLCFSLIAAAQSYPKAEIYTGYSYLRGREFEPGMSGFDVSATGNLKRWFGVAADFSGHYRHGENVHSFLFGPRFTYRGKGRVNPYFQTLIGPIIDTIFFRSPTALGWAAGGGIDVKMGKKVSIRVIDATYLLVRENGLRSSNGRASSGLVWRFGGE